LTNCRWSFATLLGVARDEERSNAATRTGESEPARVFVDVLEKICDAALVPLREKRCDATVLPLFAWAFSTANLTTPAKEQAFQYIADAIAERNIDDLTTTTVANVVCAFANDQNGGSPKEYATPVFRAVARSGEFSFMYRYILRESCLQFDSLPLTSLALPQTSSTLCSRQRLRDSPERILATLRDESAVELRGAAGLLARAFRRLRSRYRGAH
jgi:hypothetical protein